MLQLLCVPVDVTKDDNLREEEGRLKQEAHDAKEDAQHAEDRRLRKEKQLSLARKKQKEHDDKEDAQRAANQLLRLEKNRIQEKSKNGNEEPTEWTYDFQEFTEKVLDTGMYTIVPLNGLRKQAHICPVWQMSVFKEGGFITSAKFDVERYDTLFTVRQKLKNWAKEHPREIYCLDLYKNNVKLEHEKNQKTVEELGLAPEDKISNYFIK